MDKNKFRFRIIAIGLLLLLPTTLCLAQLVDPDDPGGDLPIPGILYFLAALIGIGVKKIYHGRKKD